MTAHTHSELQKIAKYHRLLLWSILAAIFANIAKFALVNNFTTLLIYLVAIAFEIFALYQLGRALKLSVVWILVFTIGLFIPILGLLILLLMHDRAMKVMKAAGIQVDFMGTNSNSLNQSDNQPNLQKASSGLASSNNREHLEGQTISESASLEPPNFEPHMPDVDIWEDMEQTFVLARKTASNPEQPAIVIVTPGHQIVLPVAIKLLTYEEKHSNRYAELERFVSLSEPQNISVIGMTEVSAGLQDVRNPGDPPFTGSRAIPFFGYLMAMGGLGHNVVIFEGHPSVLIMGCRDADVLIVDGGMLPFLQANWLDVAHSVMHRKHKIFIFQRNGEIHQV